MTDRPRITPTENGPYILENCEKITRLADGKVFEIEGTANLCRCGGSKNKPFCDGTHATIGFSAEKLDGRVPDKRDDYHGSGITIHDNRGICSHAGYCTDRLKSVFKLEEEPWIDPDGAKTREIIDTIRQCPSGALSYSLDNVEHRDQDRPPMVTVTRNGPYFVTGGIELIGQEMGDGASSEHYALCRCGASKNKPFCDGSHWHIGFED